VRHALDRRAVRFGREERRVDRAGRNADDEVRPFAGGE